MLKEIRELLREHKRLSLRELASHFSMSADALEPMLALLIQKNQIKMIDFSCGSGRSCSNCACVSREDMLQYEPASSEDTPE